MLISGLRVNERMIIKTNVEIFGRQFAENGKYIVERLPGQERRLTRANREKTLKVGDWKWVE